MFDWIYRLLRKKDNGKKNMTFDILVFDEDELADGSIGIKQHPENGVQASSRKELIGLYAMSGQKIKILREYGATSTSPINASVENVQSKTNNVPVYPQNPQPQAQTTPCPPINASIQPCASTAKFFKVAGIECKFENNKLYQKQWIKVNQTEAENYRIVSDVNNKIVQLTGKHIEKLSWVLVEDEVEKPC